MVARAPNPWAVLIGLSELYKKQTKGDTVRRGPERSPRGIQGLILSTYSVCMHEILKEQIKYISQHYACRQVIVLGSHLCRLGLNSPTPGCLRRCGGSSRAEPASAHASPFVFLDKGNISSSLLSFPHPSRSCATPKMLLSLTNFFYLFKIYICIVCLFQMGAI